MDSPCAGGCQPEGPQLCFEGPGAQGCASIASGMTRLISSRACCLCQSGVVTLPGRALPHRSSIAWEYYKSSSRVCLSLIGSFSCGEWVTTQGLLSQTPWDVTVYHCVPGVLLGVCTNTCATPTPLACKRVPVSDSWCLGGLPAQACLKGQALCCLVHHAQLAVSAAGQGHGVPSV
jgi:hypothetical protein